MSHSQSSLICGFFLLENGHRISATTSKGTHTYHYLYDSAILGVGDISWPAEIRQWSGPGSSILPNNTIVILLGRLCVPNDAPRTAQIDVISMSAFGGNPDDEHYDAPIPDTRPTITVVGHVLSKADLIANGAFRAFHLQTSEYVRDAIRQWELRLIFDMNHPRWQNAPAPFIRSAIQAVGPLHHISAEGHITVLIEHVTLALGALPASQPQSGTPQPPGDDNGTTPKKRKFKGSSSIPTTPTASASAIHPTPPPAAILPYTFNTSPAPSPSSGPSFQTAPPPSVYLSPPALHHRHSSPALSGGPVPALIVNSPPPASSINVPGPSTAADVFSAPGPSTSSLTSGSSGSSGTRRTSGRKSGTTATPRTMPLPQPAPAMESTALPPLQSFASSTSQSSGITINEPSTGLSSKQRGKRPAEGEVTQKRD